jgi:uncharacterized protein (DUF2267 family)
MIDELVGLVVKKTGISEDQAQKAVEVVFDFLKEKLPEPLAGQIDGLLAGEGAGNLLDNLPKGLGGIFNK